MQANGVLILVLLFVLRLGIPLAILLALAYFFRRLAARWAAEDEQRVEKPKVTYWAVPCWEYQGCPAAERAACPAFQRPAIPCWLAVELAEGNLSEQCLGCQIFQGSAASEIHSRPV